MGIFKAGNYAKPGKGVDAAAPHSDGAMLFFEIFFRKFWRLIQTNLLFCLFNIPAFLIIFFLAGMFSNAIFGSFPSEVAGIVGLSAPDMTNPDYLMIYRTIDIGVRFIVSVIFVVFWGSGPAYAAMHYILRNYAREENAFIWSDFWDALKDNLKQSLIMFAADVIFMFIFFYGIFFYSSQTNVLKYARYIMYCLLLFYTMVHLFVYPLMVRYRMGFMKLLRNSALFAIASLPFSILVVLLLGLLTFGIIYAGVFLTSGAGATVVLTVFILLTLIILYSFCGLIVSYNAECQIRRHIDETVVVEEKEAFKPKKAEPTNRRKLY